MAKWHALTALCLFAVVGCQSTKKQSMVDALPPPNFNGPAIRPAPAATPVRIEPVSVAVTPPTPAPGPAASKSVAGIPAAWIPSAQAKPNQWQYIVIHHSATAVGGAVRFGREHQAKGWDELGYHFVIGNGSDTAAGQVEVGGRWTKQKWGAHAKTPDNQFNEHGIGICLVGNFDQGRPSDAQMKSTAKLVAYLMKTYRIPAERIIGHGDTKATDCPGKLMNVAQVRRLSTQVLAAAGDPIPVEPARTASATGKELLVNRRTR